MYKKIAKLKEETTLVCDICGEEIKDQDDLLIVLTQARKIFRAGTETTVFDLCPRCSPKVVKLIKQEAEQ